MWKIIWEHWYEQTDVLCALHVCCLMYAACVLSYACYTCVFYVQVCVCGEGDGRMCVWGEGACVVGAY